MAARHRQSTQANLNHSSVDRSVPDDTGQPRASMWADHEIAERISKSLAESQIPILRTLVIEVHDGRATLRGQVTSYYERQLAQVRTRRVAGVKGIDDQISVREPLGPPSATQS